MQGFRPQKLSRGFDGPEGSPVRADGSAAMSPEQSERVFDAREVGGRLSEGINPVGHTGAYERADDGLVLVRSIGTKPSILI
jgi:hypothetical protein